MKDLTKVFIDLSKLSEEGQKDIISLLPKPEKPDYYEVYNNYKYLQFIPASTFGNDRWMVDKQAFGKTELLYPEFIKLFEGGEDNNGWIKIESEADLPKEIISCWFKRNNCEEIDAGLFIPRDMGDNSVVDNVLENCTHYQPIQKPLPPKF